MTPGGRRGRRPVASEESIRGDVERELESHVRMRADELVLDGWTPEEAEAEARRLLGPRRQIARACVRITSSHERVVRRGEMMDAMLQDLKYGFRTLVRSPAFSMVAVLTLALGIGANTAIFSVVDGVLLEPLPYPDAEALVDVRETRRDGGTMPVAWANFDDWRSESPAFAALAAYGFRPTTVLGGEVPVTTTVAAVSHGLWSVFGATPLEGRLTLDVDHGQGAAPVVVVSESFWANELASRPLDELLLELYGVTAEVVGVLPRDFDFPVGTDVWLPAELLGPPGTSRTAHNWRVVGRVAAGTDIRAAGEQVDALTRRIVQNDPEEASDFLAVGATVRPLRDMIVGSARQPLLLLLGAAALVLLIACTNLASTLLARGANRSRELAVRSSLGAGRYRLVRQLVTESTVLAAGGTVAGVGLAGLLVSLLKRAGPASVPRLDQVAIDGSVLAFAAAAAGLTVVLFGLFPALRLAGRRPVEDLRQGGRGNADGARGAAWTLLVGTEVALALVLVVGSGLLISSFRSALAVDAGFDAADVVSTPVSLSRVKYAEPGDHAAFLERVENELTAEPAISAAGIMSALPLAGGTPSGRIELDDDPEKNAVAGYVLASAGAFQALDIPLVEGRLFDDRDTEDAPHVAIVSRSFAERYWPGEGAVGHTVTGGGMDNFWEDRRFARVVGVVGDVRYQTLTGPPGPTVYFPPAQRPFRIQFGATVVAESVQGDPGDAAPVVRATLTSLDPDIPVELSTQREVIGASLAGREFTMILLAGFSLLALTLAVVGIYGVVSYSVATRTREMGIRLALGADRTGVMELVMKAAMRMVVAGLVVGMAVAYFLSRVVEDMLFDVAPGDPLTLALGVAILAMAGFLASLIPAWFGTRVDPIVTMRAD